jgi:hypothetical protein
VPGHYVLSVQNWLATEGWTGTLEVFGSVTRRRGGAVWLLLI